MEPLVIRIEDTQRGTTTDYAFQHGPVRIGRNARNDLCLSARFVSGWHGLVEFDEAGIRYTDLSSTNGTLVDGSRLPERVAVPIQSGASLWIGALRLRFPPRVESLVPPVPTTEVMRLEDPPSARVSGEKPSSTPVSGIPAGGISRIMRMLAEAPPEDFDRAWGRVLLPGAVIGRFELIREIGRGSVGMVFEAKDRQLNRRVAFKAVKPGRESQILLRQELLQKEAEAVARFNHPNIVSLYDAGSCDSGPYLIMELLTGETLRTRLQAGPMALNESLEVAIEIGWGLAHAHAAGVIHRDLKPANVFLTSDARVKVLDFGIAHVFGVGARAGVGTPAYMAPEQWRLGKQDTRTDVFGAAATLTEMLTGRLPYAVTEDRSAALEPGARPRLDPSVPRDLADLLRRALAPKPDERPRDGKAWLDELIAIHGRVDAARPFSWRRPGGPDLRLTLLATAAAAGAIATIAYLLLR